MTTIREYAKRHNVSYEAIRSQVSRYKKQLEEHISTKGQTMYLDDFAVDFLDSRRKDNPIVVMSQDQREEADRLRQQVEALKNELMTTQKRVIELQSENQLMLEAKVKYDLLLESSNEKQTLIDTLRDDLSAARQDADQLKENLKSAEENISQVSKERDAAQAEASSYKRSIFGFYRKIK